MNNVTSIPYGHQSINEDDIKAVVQILRGDWLTMGPSVERFESLFADYVCAKHAISFSNGTAALHGAMHAADVTAGDVVIAPPLTFAATSNAAIYCGGEPVFADISPDALCLDPLAAEQIALSHGSRVKVIAPVSFAGYPVDVPAFRGLAQRYGALIIEDASHALGASRDGRKVGVDADMTTFSFHPVKHITTCEGGMVITNSDALAEKLRLFRSHGIVKQPDKFVRHYDGPWDNDMIELGYNYRLNDVSCALGASQLERLDSFVARRREIAAMYREKLRDVDELTLPPDHEGHAYHLFPIHVTPEKRKFVFEYLRKKGIGVQVHYIPVYRHTYYREKFPFKAADFPNTENYSAGEISLPVFPSLSDQQVGFVVDVLKRALSEANSII